MHQFNRDLWLLRWCQKKKKRTSLQRSIKCHITASPLALISLPLPFCSSPFCRRRMYACWGSSRKWTPPHAPVHCGIWMRTRSTSFTSRASVWEAAAPPVSRSSSERPKSRRRWRPRAQVRDNNTLFLLGYLDIYLVCSFTYWDLFPTYICMYKWIF